MSSRRCFAKREVEEDVAVQVKRIIADVRARGDAALVELSNEFDRADLTQATLKISAAEIDAAIARFLKHREKRHRTQPGGSKPIIAANCRTTRLSLTRPERGWAGAGHGRTSAGLYIARRRPAYPAGADERDPARGRSEPDRDGDTGQRGGRSNPLVLAAAVTRWRGRHLPCRRSAGHRRFGLWQRKHPGGGQDRGTRQCMGGCRQAQGIPARSGIDSIAGPSEILVIADAANDPDWIAADLPQAKPSTTRPLQHPDHQRCGFCRSR